MKVSILTALLLLLCSIPSFSQTENIDLLVQSPDGRTVKLVWFVKNWNTNITGFDIRRKDGIGEWVKLNKEPIVPGISLKKKLTIVESDNAEVGRIKDKQATLVKQGRLSEISSDAYLAKLNSNDKQIQEIAAMMTTDLDIALMSGFGFVDNTVAQRTDYQYGLFIQGTDKLLAKVSWNYGEIPDLNVVTEITSRSVPGKSGIHIIWDANLGKMRTGYVAGFNIYRQGIRLNEQPITAANSKDLSEFTWYDRSANSGRPTQYSISAVSLFGIEGIIRSYTYEPSDHPAEHKRTQVTRIASLGYYFKDGTDIRWTFPKEYERFIKGFYVQKDNMPEGYKQVSGLLGPAERAFVDKTGSPVSSYVRVRVDAVYNDKTITPGGERLYNYFPISEPPRPMNARAKGTTDDKRYLVRISWDPRMAGDSTTEYYKVYTAQGSDVSIVADRLPVKTPNYTHTISRGNAATYRYYIAAVSRTGFESLSDTMTIQVPGLELPAPVISVASVSGRKAIIQWQYADIADLKGFRLYQGTMLIANEAVLKKGIGQYAVPDLAEGSYEFSLQAVSESGVVSERSAPVQLAVSKK